jgi:drug/metabolite transporter (DMT)-like permease
MALGGTAVLALWNGVFIFDAGIFWTLLGALSIGGYNIVQRQCSKNYTAIQITAYSFFSATILMIFFLPSATQSFVHAQAAQQLIVIGLAIFPSVIGYLSWAKALSIAEKTSTVVNYMYLTPFFALIFGILLLDEIPHAGILIGGAIILLALFIFNLALKRQKKLLESASKTFNVPEP